MVSFVMGKFDSKGDAMRTLISSLLVLILLAPAGPVLAQPKKPTDPGKKPTPDKTSPTEQGPTLVGGRTFDSWRRDLKAIDPSLKHNAINAIQYFGDDNAAAVKDLVYILENDFDTALRCNAAIALQRVAVYDGEGGKPDEVPLVVKALWMQLDRHPQVNVRYYSAYTLGRFAAHAESAIPYLVKYSQEYNEPATTGRPSGRVSWEVRHACVQSLINIGRNNKPIDTKITRALLEAQYRDPAAAVRHDAFMGLATMGPPKPELQDLVKKAMEKKKDDKRADKSVVVWAYYGLMSQQGVNKNYLEELTKLLLVSEVQTRVEAINALFMLGMVLKRDAKEAIAVMVEMLDDKDPDVFGAASWSIGQLSDVVGISDRAQTILKRIIEDEDVKQQKREKPKEREFKSPKRIRAEYILAILKGEIDPKTGKEKKTTAKKPEPKRN
jgi:HEAT repeat protein